jgi:glutamate-ammonia-ligase adenylyltransferase
MLALGKAGSKEMLAGSDLDLMLIYDHAPMETAPTQYFVRLAHSLTGAITARARKARCTGSICGCARPATRDPVAVSLASFRHYHAAESWTWERLALDPRQRAGQHAGFAAILDSRKSACAFPPARCGFDARRHLRRCSPRSTRKSPNPAHGT